MGNAFLTRITSRVGPMAIALSTAVTVGCGLDPSAPTGDSVRPPVETPAPTPPPSVVPTTASQVVMRLYEAAPVFARVAAAGLEATTIDNAFWTVGPCVFNSGTLRIALDGVPLGTRIALPHGTHTVAVDFSNCLVDGLVGSVLRGATSAQYSTSDFETISAELVASSVHAELFEFRSDLYSVTASGSGALSRTRSSDGGSMRFIPHADARLTNALTGRVAVFGGGSFSRRSLDPPAGVSAFTRDEFEDLVLTIDGTTYRLNGTLEARYGFVADQVAWSGEVRLTNQGVLVARVYGDERKAQRIEVLQPLATY